MGDSKRFSSRFFKIVHRKYPSLLLNSPPTIQFYQKPTGGQICKTPLVQSCLASCVRFRGGCHAPTQQRQHSITKKPVRALKSDQNSGLCSSAGLARIILGTAQVLGLQQFCTLSFPSAFVCNCTSKDRPAERKAVHR